MNKKKPTKPKRKGFTALVMLIIAVLLITGIGLLGLGLDSRILAIRDTSGVAARCAADSGLTKAIYEMNEKLKVKPWDDSTLPQVTNESLPSCNATYSYTVTGDSVNGYAVESTGKSMEAEKTVRCVLGLISPFDSALFVQETLILKPNAQVLGYNSADPEDTDVNVKIGTNDTADGSITLGSGVVVDGDVVVGPGGDANSVIDDQGATTGDRYAITTEKDFPGITAPTLFDMGGVISAHGTTLTIGPANSGEYDGIELKNATNPGILEIDGGDVVLYITENINLGQDCEIKINEGSSLVIYLDGDLIGDNDAGVNNMNAPENFKLYGTGEEQTIDLKAKNDFYGAVYAPNADITINSGGDLYGSFIGSSFEMKSNSNFYYDEALIDASLDDEAVHFVVTQWSE
jgi:choice-of-anchor A domain-containing protein